MASTWDMMLLPGVFVVRCCRKASGLGMVRQYARRAPDAAQRSCGALLIRGPYVYDVSVVRGSAVHREERCTAPGTRSPFTSPRLRGEVGLRSNPGDGDAPQ